MFATTNSVASCTAQRTLAASQVFAGLDEKLLAKLAAASHRERYPRGSALYEEGSPAEALILIVSGIVKVARGPSAGGNVLGLFGPRECIGAGAVVFGGHHTVTAHAASGVVEALRIPAAAVRDSMAQDAELASAMMRALFNYTAVLTEKLDILHAGSVPQRLARLFLVLSERFGDELEQGSLVIPIPLSRRELSAFVGARVESVIRAVSAWQKRGVLRTSPLGFEILVPQALRDIADGSGSDVLTLPSEDSPLRATHA